MNATVITLLDSAKARMSGYAALLNYRYMNLSVKAEPAALLSFTVNVAGAEWPLEKAARVRNAPGREDQFEIYPNSADLATPILKGLFSAHPEYKTEIKQVEDADNPGDSYLLVTVPEVDKNRHDLLMQGVGTLADICKGQMDAVMETLTPQLAFKMTNATPEALKEAKDALQNLYDQHQDMCKQFRADKEQEIEEAYKKYQEQHAAQQKEQEEKDAAENEQAGMQMRMNRTEDDQ